MPESKSHLVVIGSHAPGILVRVKRIPVAGETVIGWGLEEAQDGGKGSNQAIAAARLGISTSFVGCIGVDGLGAECEKMLIEEGVDISYLYRSHSTGTGAGIIILNDNGVPAMVTAMGANEELNNQLVENALESLSNARVMLTQFEIQPQVALYAARISRNYNMITIVNPAPAYPVNLVDLECADILVPNEVEAKTLLRFDLDSPIDLETLAQKLLSSTRAGKVIITAGKQGIVGADSSGSWRALPPPISVVDTSGAGDVFCAALAAGLINGLDHRAASIWACSVAALSVAREGTIPSFPTQQEIDSFYQKESTLR
jgi:ribokinase